MRTNLFKEGQLWVTFIILIYKCVTCVILGLGLMVSFFLVHHLHMMKDFVDWFCLQQQLVMMVHHCGVMRWPNITATLFLVSGEEEDPIEEKLASGHLHG